MALPAWITIGTTGVTLNLKVQPRASKNEISGAIGTQLKVKVTSPPVDAAANQAVVEMLADLLDCSRGSFQILRGQTSQNKVVLVRGIPAERIVALLGCNE